MDMIRRQNTDSDNTDVGIDVSIVMPCLNEAKTIVQCIREANDFFEHEALRGEVVAVSYTHLTLPTILLV